MTMPGPSVNSSSFGEATRWIGDAYEASQRAKGERGTVKIAALVQTPGFVGAFLLDRTLDPAIEEFGLEEIRIIDPACGTGHLLCQAFDRLWPLWEDRHPGLSPMVRAQRVLDAIHGVDLDRMCVALARFRLGLSASNAAGIKFLETAPQWRIHVVWGDSLLPADDPLQPWNRDPKPEWCLGGLATP
jgi:hypothetical protein